LGDLRDFWWTTSNESARTGTWSGPSLELWVTLFAHSTGLFAVAESIRRQRSIVGSKASALRGALVEIFDDQGAPRRFDWTCRHGKR
jgi:hypothetical protein